MLEVFAGIKILVDNLPLEVYDLLNAGHVLLSLHPLLLRPRPNNLPPPPNSNPTPTTTPPLTPHPITTSKPILIHIPTLPLTHTFIQISLPPLRSLLLHLPLPLPLPLALHLALEQRLASPAARFSLLLGGEAGVAEGGLLEGGVACFGCGGDAWSGLGGCGLSGEVGFCAVGLAGLGSVGVVFFWLGRGERAVGAA